MDITQINTEDRPWGNYLLLYADANYWTKIININPGQSLSLQKHQYRNEFWIPITEGMRAIIGYENVELLVGGRYTVKADQIHRIMNPTQESGIVIEVAQGMPMEDDILRLEDHYGRV